MQLLTGKDTRSAKVRWPDQSEISLSVPADLREEAAGFLEYIVEYLDVSNTRIHADETLTYGFWMVRFERDASDLAVTELDLDDERFRPGVQNALLFWRSQHEVCNRAGSPFTPPALDQLVACAPGTLEGAGVQGWRYNAPPHMSGWWLTTEAFDGDADKMTLEHARHLPSRRPDLTQYLALAPGHGFDTDSGQLLWDPALAAASVE